LTFFFFRFFGNCLRWFFLFWNLHQIFFFLLSLLGGLFPTPLNFGHTFSVKVNFPHDFYALKLWSFSRNFFCLWFLFLLLLDRLGFPHGFGFFYLLRLRFRFSPNGKRLVMSLTNG